MLGQGSPRIRVEEGILHIVSEDGEEEVELLNVEVDRLQQEIVEPIARPDREQELTQLDEDTKYHLDTLRGYAMKYIKYLWSKGISKLYIPHGVVEESVSILKKNSKIFR